VLYGQHVNYICKYKQRNLCLHADLRSVNRGWISVLLLNVISIEYACVLTVLRVKIVAWMMLVSLGNV